MLKYQLKWLAFAVVALIVAFIAYAVTTKSGGKFDPTADAEVMQKRLEKQVGKAEKNTKKAAKKAKRTAKKGKKLLTNPTGGKGSAGKQYKKNMDMLQ